MAAILPQRDRFNQSVNLFSVIMILSKKADQNGLPFLFFSILIAISGCAANPPIQGFLFSVELRKSFGKFPLNLRAS